MGLQTLVLCTFLSISVVNVCIAAYVPSYGSPRVMWPFLWDDPTADTTDFLAKAQQIAAAKVNKGFEMKKEGIKIAQQSMKNKFAIMGADEAKKAATTPPTTILGTDPLPIEQLPLDSVYYPRYMPSSSSEEDGSYADQDIY